MRSRFLTEADLRHFCRNGARVRGEGVSGSTSVVARSAQPKEPVQGRQTPTPLIYNGQEYKSKTEVRFVMHLDAMKHAGEIAGWQYEPVNFRLPGKKNYYKPDFLVQDSHGLTFYDTKGFNKSDDRSLVKIKTAAGLNRWATFKQTRWIKGEWIERVIEV